MGQIIYPGPHANVDVYLSTGMVTLQRNVQYVVPDVDEVKLLGQGWLPGDDGVPSIMPPVPTTPVWRQAAVNVRGATDGARVVFDGASESGFSLSVDGGIRRYTERGVEGSPANVTTTPPTVTLSAGNAATTIAGSTLTLAISGGVIPAGTPYRYQSSTWLPWTSNPAYATQKDTSTNNQLGVGQVEFWTDADKFEIVIKGGGQNARLMVDGQLITRAAIGIPGDGAEYRILVDFGTAAVGRRITMGGIGLYLKGVQQHPKFGLAKPPRPIGPRAVIVGDSYVYGNGSQIPTGGGDAGFAHRLGRRLGFSDTLALGVPSSGYVSAGNSVPYGHATRIADVTQYAPDLVIVYGTTNDANASGVGPAASALFQALMAALPKAVLAVVGPIDPNGSSRANLIANVRDPVKAAAQALNLPFVDALDYFSGTGNSGNLKNDGNRDRYLYSDNLHPTSDGHEYIAARMATELELLIAPRFAR